MATAKPLVNSTLIVNIRRLLAHRPNGVEIRQLSRIYFEDFGTFAPIQESGVKTWTEILTSAELATYCVLHDNDKMVKLNPSASSNGSSAASMNGDVLSATPSSSLTVNGNKSKQNGSAQEKGTHNHNIVVLKKSGSKSPSPQGSKRVRDGVSTNGIGQSDPKSETDFSEVSHVSLTPQNKTILDEERRRILWIPSEEYPLPPLNFNTLVLSRKLAATGNTPSYIDTSFCEKHLLESIMALKNKIREVRGKSTFYDTRARLNTFDSKAFGFFQHGNAIKMANIDAVMGMALSNPVAMSAGSMIHGNDLLYFVDIYGGSGGFAEYFLWKKKWLAKGFGIAQNGTDYNLAQAEHFPKESFEVFPDDCGNVSERLHGIKRPFFVAKFINFIKESTMFNGVHVVVANGGDVVDSTNDDDLKEVNCKSMFMAEILIALQVLRDGGHFVMRIYDIFTPTTVALLYLLKQTFQMVSIYKPDTCLPASPEKYVLCKWKKSNNAVKEIASYIAECHKVEWLTRSERKAKNRSGTIDPTVEITDILSPELIFDSTEFMKYIRSSNSKLGNRQVNETNDLVSKIKESRSEKFIAEHLADLQKKCETLWEIPHKVRVVPKYSKAKTPGIRAIKLLTPYSFDFIKKTEVEGESDLCMGTLLTELTCPKEWSFMAVGPERGFFMSLGGHEVYKYDLNGGDWKLLEEAVELMNNTLVYADLVDEYEIRGIKQTICKSLHIIDAMVLGGMDVRDLPSNERFELITKYANSMNKTSRTDLCAIRPKLTYEIKHMQRFLSSITKQKIRDWNGERVDGYLARVGSNKFKFVTCGVLFIKPFKTNFVPGDFRFCLQNRLYWSWSDKVDVNIPTDFFPGPLDFKEYEDENDEDNVVPVHGVTILKYFSQYIEK